MRVETEIRFKMGLTPGVRAALHSYAFETLPIRQNLVGHRSKMLSRRPEAPKHRWASLQIAFEASLERQNLAGDRSKLLSKRPEAPKHRWASLQIAFEASPDRQNLTEHRSKLLSKRSCDAENALAAERNRFQNALATRFGRRAESLSECRRCLCVVLRRARI